MVRKNAAVPDTPEAFAEWLENRGVSAADMVSYAVAAMSRDPGLREQLLQQLGAVEAPPAPDLSPAAALNGLFADLGDFVHAVFTRSDPRLDQVRRIQDAMAERVPSQGGFLVPDAFRMDLLQAALEFAIVRPRAVNIPMDTLRVSVPAQDDPTHASSTFGVTGYWTEEAAPLSESTPVYERIVLEAKKLTALHTMPNELLADGGQALGAYLGQILPQALAWFEDLAYITGTGVGEPQGVLNAPCGISITRNTGSKVLLVDIQSMVTRMWPVGFARPSKLCWLCSPDVLNQLVNMYLSIGSPTNTAVPPPDLLVFDPVTGWRMLGIQLYATEKSPALGTKGDLALVDFGAYLLGTRGLAQLQVSPVPKFQNDVSMVRVKSRVDGRMWPQTALTPQNGSQTVGPVVVLN